MKVKNMNFVDIGCEEMLSRFIEEARKENMDDYQDVHNMDEVEEQFICCSVIFRTRINGNGYFRFLNDIAKHFFDMEEHDSNAYSEFLIAAQEYLSKRGIHSSDYGDCVLLGLDSKSGRYISSVYKKDVTFENSDTEGEIKAKLYEIADGIKNKYRS